MSNKLFIWLSVKNKTGAVAVMLMVICAVLPARGASTGLQIWVPAASLGRRSYPDTWCGLVWFQCWMTAAVTSSFNSHWPGLLERLSGVLDLEASARATGALMRRRAVGDAATLLRLALAHDPGGLSGVAQLSDVALRRRLRGATAWLGQIAGALLSARAAAGDSVQNRRLRIVDGSSVSHPGADGTSWQLHAAYDPATAGFTDLELTGPEVGEWFAQFAFARHDVAVGDRGYAKAAGLGHVLASAADFLVRVGWNSLRITDSEGTRLDLADIYNRLVPGQTTQLSVVVTRPGQGRGSQPLNLFRPVSSCFASTKRRQTGRSARSGGGTTRSGHGGRLSPGGTGSGDGAELAVVASDHGAADRGRRRRVPRRSLLYAVQAYIRRCRCGDCTARFDWRCSGQSSNRRKGIRYANTSKAD